jgi:hypothetical protein
MKRIGPWRKGAGDAKPRCRPQFGPAVLCRSVRARLLLRRQSSVHGSPADGMELRHPGDLSRVRGAHQVRDHDPGCVAGVLAGIVRGETPPRQPPRRRRYTPRVTDPLRKMHSLSLGRSLCHCEERSPPAGGQSRNSQENGEPAHGTVGPGIASLRSQ